MFLSVNDSWLHTLGWGVDELVGRSFLDFVHEHDHATSGQAMVAEVGGAAGSHENRYLHKAGGHRWISWTSNHDGDSILASGRDVTDEKQAALQLATAQEQLRQSQKMEAVGQLTGRRRARFQQHPAGHRGQPALLGRLAAHDERMETRIHSAQEAVRRGARLSNQLLAFSRRQALAPCVLNAGRLVAGMEDMLRRALGEATELEFVVSGGLWNTFADPTQIENAVLNLAINARDAMAGRGKLTVEVGNARLDDQLRRPPTSRSWPAST